jgi:hypothetical protein
MNCSKSVSVCTGCTWMSIEYPYGLYRPNLPAKEALVILLLNEQGFLTNSRQSR